MKQLESGSKEIIKWNKYQSKVTAKTKQIFRLHSWSRFSGSK